MIKRILPLSPEVRKFVSEAIDTQMSIFKEISGRKGGFDKMVEMFGYEGDDPIDFLHGYLAGSISETAFLSARLTIGKALTDDERNEVHALAKEQNISIKEIITIIRNV